VLFVHGAGTPAEVAFDVPSGDYSWMAYLANAGFDVFSVDMTGYGRSTRPAPMNDPCNLAENQRALFTAPCTPSYGYALTNISSDWNDVGAAVDYVRLLRRVDRVSLVAWSLGGPRAGGYAAQNPSKVNRLVLLAPGYNRTSRGKHRSFPLTARRSTRNRVPSSMQLGSQVGCPAQYDRAVSDAVWSAMIESDTVGATWGPASAALRRRRRGLESGDRREDDDADADGGRIHDKQVPARARPCIVCRSRAPQKVLVDLGCSSHNAMWEKNHLEMFRASLEWLEKGTVNGAKDGVVRLGY
jgi:pimeloyl-ACP methyl ester carboxylesterase